MSIIYMLLAISVIVAVVFFAAFVLSVKNGQYDDTYTPSVRMLFDDELVKDKKPATKKPATPNTNNHNPKLN
ncbi:cbb3-type cytochrome oxidase maturation protein [Gillisia sp. Hel_I_86]|uniref:cbb3-type cytochrome oxidase assembly protein CcoS n=1 Tax=Gillisia sp. Hel_I_86 TaxID=1249981 RepID=UPI00119AE827|nr:cbb3-type cytochrome oxidase assembly protein CcoS [Gillisia sp. Hel_I_86]TVZ25534.1 cbb3-type cytochrome oxidase maturation protein [Gillisia sp. Hel_I_86]